MGMENAAVPIRKAIVSKPKVARMPSAQIETKIVLWSSLRLVVHTVKATQHTSVSINRALGLIAQLVLLHRPPLKESEG